MQRAYTGISNSLRRLFISLVAIILSGCSNLSSLLFYPQTGYIRTPADIHLEYQTVPLQAVDGTKLNAWWLPADGVDQSTAPTVLFLHGNAENISTHIGSVYWLPEKGVNVLLLDYRGYGTSEGTPVLPNVFQDVEAAVIWLAEQQPSSPLFIFGQSIGASIAAYSAPKLAKSYEFEGVILDAGFSGYRAVARDVTSRGLLSAILLWPFTWLLPTDWDGEDYIAELSPVPLLMFHSQDDQTISYELGKRLYDQANEPKQWVESKGEHIQTFNFPEMRQEMLNFLFR